MCRASCARPLTGSRARLAVHCTAGSIPGIGFGCQPRPRSPQLLAQTLVSSRDLAAPVAPPRPAQAPARQLPSSGPPGATLLLPPPAEARWVRHRATYQGAFGKAGVKRRPARGAQLFSSNLYPLPAGCPTATRRPSGRARCGAPMAPYMPRRACPRLLRCRRPGQPATRTTRVYPYLLIIYLDL